MDLQEMLKIMDTNRLQVTLMAFADLISGNTIFLNKGWSAYKELEQVATQQIIDLAETNGKDWRGYTAFEEVRKKYVTDLSPQNPSKSSWDWTF
jgi:hypothetical protein